LYVSAVEPFDIIYDKLAIGSYIMIDDFVNLDTENRTISDIFFKKFQNNNVVFVSNFGVSGVVYRYLG
jgi:hypothetical protein